MALRIAVIPGDGIGQRVVPAGLEVLRAASSQEPGFEWTHETFPWGSEYHGRHGAMMPPEALSVLSQFDAIYFGAAGWPSVADDVSLWGLRLAIVHGFDQCVSVRPVRLPPGIDGPLRDRTPADIDFVVVRENSEGEYSGAGGRVHRGYEGEVAVETAVFSRRRIERVARHAFELASTRPAGRVSSVTKSNAQRHGFVLWDEVVREVAADYPGVETGSVLVDAAAALLVLDPGSFDVILGSNLHADILSDLTGALAGSLGVAPSGNYNVDRVHPSMFEPVHGSAPDLVDGGTANPIGAILSAAMMVEWLGHSAVGAAMRQAVDATCEAGIVTPDLGGQATIDEVTAAIVGRLGQPLATVQIGGSGTE